MTARAKEFIKSHGDMVVSYSGGKDSTAVYLLACELGVPFRTVFADTGNEHELTLDYVNTIHEKTGGPAVEMVRQDFPEERFARRRAWIAEHWPQHGIAQSVVDRAVSCMVRTGNPFLDLCMLKGRFPSRRAQFCTSELKTVPIEEQIIIPGSQQAHASGRRLVSMIGVRRDESSARRHALMWQWGDFGVVQYRPIVHWTAQQAIDFHHRHNIEPNPLYRLGMRRVGCMPCINCNKGELREIATRFPDHIDRIAQWEDIIREVSKRSDGSFFAAPKNGVFEGMRSIHEWVSWSRTSHGGRQLNLDALMPLTTCQSDYGLCE